MLSFIRIVVISLALLSCQSTRALIVNDLSSTIDQWTLKSCDDKIGSIPASVPGVVHTDLIRAGVITEDPYYRYNELNLSWVAETCWEYKLMFDNSLSLEDDDVFMLFKEIDTIATIFLNDNLVGSTSNAFRSHFLPINPKTLLEMGNTIRVVIDSPLSYTSTKSASYPYEIPSTANYNVWLEPSHRAFIRKTGSDFGWDWGPAFVQTGITGKVFLVRSSPSHGYLDGLSIVQHGLAESNYMHTNLLVRAHLTGLSCSMKARNSWKSFSVYLDDQLVFSQKIHIPGPSSSQPCESSPESYYDVLANVTSVAIIDPELWWPIDAGKQHLYALKVVYEDDQELIKRIGIRTVELIQNPMISGGKSFFFRVNNVDIFMKGANFIPIDSFNSRVSTNDLRYTFNASVAANMNMLRVWGGGKYQPDEFYDIADELGVLVWQEFMFACSMYPVDSMFLSEVTKEVEYQVLRLNSHPSIIIWGGNNENEVALDWFLASQTNRDLYVSDYSR
jgi:beta-mannosidase